MMIYARSLEESHHAPRGKLSSNAGSKAEQHPFMVVFTVQPLRFMEMLPERLDDALTGLDKEVSDGSTSWVGVEEKLNKAPVWTHTQ